MHQLYILKGQKFFTLISKALLMLLPQVDATEKAMLELIALGIENNIKFSAVWFGSFIALVWCVRPETIKPVLKGINSFNLSQI